MKKKRSKIAFMVQNKPKYLSKRLRVKKREINRQIRLFLKRKRKKRKRKRNTKPKNMAIIRFELGGKIRVKKITTSSGIRKNALVFNIG